MKIHIRSGQNVTAVLEPALQRMPRGIRNFLVLGVTRESLLVAEPDSPNGYAKIVCRGITKREVAYHYMYGDKKIAYVMRLEDERGKEISLSRFIEDDDQGGTC